MNQQDAVDVCAVREGTPEAVLDPSVREIPGLSWLERSQVTKVIEMANDRKSDLQGVYPLSPPQEGMLFEHLLRSDEDTYILSKLIRLRCRAQLDLLVEALRQVVNRHDILRSAIWWEGLEKAVQVVFRQVSLPVEAIELPRGRSAYDELCSRMTPGQSHWNLREPPLLRLEIAADREDGPWYVLLKVHHIICDHRSLRIITSELVGLLVAGAYEIRNLGSYQNYMNEMLSSRRSTEDANRYFIEKLGTVDAPTVPFGIFNDRGRSVRLKEARSSTGVCLAQQIRATASRYGISAARMFHSAWALVVAATSGRDDVVYGTVVLSRRARTMRSYGVLSMGVNTLPLRLHLRGKTARALIEQTHRELCELLEHEQVPLSLARDHCDVLGDAHLFTSVLNFRHSRPTFAFGRCDAAGVSILATGEAWTDHPISIVVDDVGDDFSLLAQTYPSLEPHRLIEYLNAAMQSLVEALEGAPDTPALALPVLPHLERVRTLRQFNATHLNFPRERLIQELFELQVERNQDKVAVVHRDQFLTYSELNSRSNQLASYLKKRDVGPDQLVGICIERSIELIVGMFGCLKSGGGYIPLDPTHPLERLRYMISDSSPVVVLTQEKFKNKFSEYGKQLISLDVGWPDIARRESGNHENMAPYSTGSQLAYVIYTSGSTGKPKGVMIDHTSVINLWRGLTPIYRGSTNIRAALNASVNFDASVQQIVQLLSGGTVFLLDLETRKDPSDLVNFTCVNDIESIDCTPSQLRTWIDAGLFKRESKAPQVILVGGEAIDSPLWRTLASNDRTEVYNVYGPTECTVDSTAARLTGDTSDPHIGKPMPNRRLYVLNSNQNPVPIGAVGEIYIGGEGVGRGYLNKPTLTAERFIADPFYEEQRRMYRTGDLGRWREDGTIEYLGRNDHQVKIRGFRVELGEIEAQLQRYPQVREAVVVVREDTPGDEQLVAYLVPARAFTGLLPVADTFRTCLKEVLPDYMIPSAFVTLEELPLTPSGKLDRSTLPAPSRWAYATRPYQPPLGEVEEILARIWQELLGVPLVGRHDNFFELGGHSLLIVQMLDKLRHAGLSAEARQIFGNLKLSDLAGVLTNRVAETNGVPENQIPLGCQEITPQMLPLVELEAEHIDRIVRAVPGGAANIEDIYPLSPLQEGILFHHLMDEEQQKTDVYARTMLMLLSSQDKLDQLRAALQFAINRHEVLRTAVLWEELPRPIQVVCRQATLSVEPIRFDKDRDPLEQVKERMNSKVQLDLRRAPLIQLQVATESYGGGWYALLHTHHIAFDNESAEILMMEVIAFMQSRTPELPASVPYRNHIAQSLAYARMHDAEKFFREKLGDVDEPTAPFGLLDVHGGVDRIQKGKQVLDSKQANSVRLQARRLGVSAATLFHAAWALVVARTSGRSDVVFGSVLLGRLLSSAGVGQTLGMFINTLPLRLRLNHVTVSQLVERTQRELVDLVCHEQASLMLAQRCSAVAGTTPLFSSLLNYRHVDLDFKRRWADGSGLRLVEVYGTTNYPLVLSVNDLREGFELEMETDQRVDPLRFISYVSTAMSSLLEALETAPQTPALALNVLPLVERHQVLRKFNAVPMVHSHEKRIHEIFEEQVDRWSDAVAMVYEDQSLTYTELNARANQLARYLRRYGAGGPDQLVGICLERGLDMMIGLLAILKSEGAYVPLDPNYPSDRVAYTLSDSNLKFLLTQQSIKERLPNGTTIVITLDAEWSEIAKEERANLVANTGGSGSRHLAYVIYTSGSTGRPKGVMIEHRNVVRLFSATDEWFRFNEHDVWTLFHSYAFDFSVWEIWGALLFGGRLVIVPYLTSRSPDEFYGLLCKFGVTVLNQTPTAFTQLIEAQSRSRGKSQSLRVVIFGGESLEPHVLRPWVNRNGMEAPRLVNMYGITETTVHVTYKHLVVDEVINATRSLVGTAIPDLQVYLLGPYLEPVPLGVIGELYVGGAGVSRGYLNRPELTAERFVTDPFSNELGARLYKSGDLGRWCEDGTIEYLGRNDYQVKIRGFRIELGEIEALLLRHPQVRETVVLAREDISGERRLVAYVALRTAGIGVPLGAEVFRAYLKEILPEHMIPSAFVVLDTLPLTSNGKLDRRALPVPDFEAYVSRRYEAPQGEVEEILAGIWRDILRVTRVGRWDNFFELGGHSLLIVQMIERLRRFGLSVEIRRVFYSATLSELATAMTDKIVGPIKLPPNLIPPGCQHITPSMLTLVELDESHLDYVAKMVPGGAPNIQDIYPLVPLQEGMLFHHLLDATGSDTYVVSILLSICSRGKLDELIRALQRVINRHDVMRTAILWEQLPRPIQVVYRSAMLPIEYIVWPEQDELAQWFKPERRRLSLNRAPLIRLQIASAPEDEHCKAVLQLHHIICDNLSYQAMMDEVTSILRGEDAPFEPPPFRNHVAQALEYERLHGAEAYFTKYLGDVRDPTAPFGQVDIHKERVNIDEAHIQVDTALSDRLRAQARRLGVSSATLFHAAFGLFVAHTSDRNDVVFGSVMFGRLHGDEDSQRALGMYINTLPVRLRLEGVDAVELVQQTQAALIDLLQYEQSSLSLAQRCSGIEVSVPLFSTILNFRHGVVNPAAKLAKSDGLEVLGWFARTNYPIVISVDDLQSEFSITAQTDCDVPASRIAEYMRVAIQSLTEALEVRSPQGALHLNILPAAERRDILSAFNETEVPHIRASRIHVLFEEQAALTPELVAVLHAQEFGTYSEINRRANRVAHLLKARGVGSEYRVAVCLERGIDMVVALLGILKSGACYVPLDPGYPPNRLEYMLQDAKPEVVISHGKLSTILAGFIKNWVDIACLQGTGGSDTNPMPEDVEDDAGGLVYQIYTSGSTGRPKGTEMSHRSMENLIRWQRENLPVRPGVRVLQFAALSFDVAFQEIFSTLCLGGTLVLLDEWERRDISALTDILNTSVVERMFIPPMLLQALSDHCESTGSTVESLRDVIVAGEQLRVTPEIVGFFRRLKSCHLHNHYGPTETHVVTALTLSGDPGAWPTLPPIGRPISNTQIYILNNVRELVPVGVAGEIYVGGAGVARGYFNRAELTAERFTADPFGYSAGARVYRTGDLGKWHADGTIEYLGRNDNQAKIRGFRVELGEVETQLLRHPKVRGAAVVVREDVPGEKRLVAYLVPTEEPERTVDAEIMRAHLKEVLPDYMVPGIFIAMESLPSTPSGKLDRRMLPPPDFRAYAPRRHEAPEGEVEQVLARIWQELLHVRQVDRWHDFFELGGDSLLALRLIVKVSVIFQVQLKVQFVLRNSTLQSMANRIEFLKLEKQPIKEAREMDFESGVL